MDAITPKVTQGPLPASTKIYLKGEIHPEIRVPMREIALHPTAGEPPVRVYDSSGPYTDPDVDIDIDNGLPALRADWIAARGDTEAYEGREVRPEDNGDVASEFLTPEFPNLRQPRRARDNGAATQLAYARAGIVTAEMEYAAIRENLGRQAAREALERDGGGFRRRNPRQRDGRVRPRRDRPRPGHPAGQHQPSGIGTDGHRAQLPGQDQRQHRQFGRHLVDGRGSGQDGLGHPLGRRHGDGPLDRAQHPQYSRMDPAQFPGADRHGADLSGAGEGRRYRRGPDLGDLSRHPDRTG